MVFLGSCEISQVACSCTGPVLLLKYPHQLRITATTSGLRDLPPPGPLKQLFQSPHYHVDPFQSTEV